jgi:hypothetical protein
VRDAERRIIGFVPAGRTDVVIDDPYGSANGSAYPFLRGPAVFLWPVPPTPRSFIGNSRDWGEILAVHEFAHIAHLTRPSRNPLQRTWRGLLPEGIGPVATRTPRWAIEGYATYVEGWSPARAAPTRRSAPRSCAAGRSRARSPATAPSTAAAATSVGASPT